MKVTDFGLTRKENATVKYLEYTNNYMSPELCETVANEVLTVNKAIDVWALGEWDIDKITLQFERPHPSYFSDLYSLPGKLLSLYLSLNA